MRRHLTAAVLAAATLSPALPGASAQPQAAQPAKRTQLGMSLGLSAEEEARLTTHQLVMLKQVMDNPNLPEGEKRMRIKWILEGTVPRFSFRF